jgi:hypothetical protein
MNVSPCGFKVKEFALKFPKNLMTNQQMWKENAVEKWQAHKAQIVARVQEFESPF